MKTSMMKMFLALGAVVVFGGQVYAQAEDSGLTARVPFAFQVSSTTFEAGKYTIVQAPNLPPTLRRVGSGHGVFIAGAMASLSGKSDPKLVFRCYNHETCFLTQIWTGVGNGVDVAQSKAEKAMINGDYPKEVALISVDLRRAD